MTGNIYTIRVVIASISYDIFMKYRKSYLGKMTR